MNARISSASSIILHIALLAMLSVMTLRSQNIAPPAPPVEIEISDFADIPPLPEPIVPTDSDVNESLTEAPEFTPANAGNPEPAERPEPRPQPSATQPVVASQPLQPTPSQPTVRPAPEVQAAPELAPAPVKPVPTVPLSAESRDVKQPSAAPTPAAVPTPPAPVRRLNASALSQSLAAQNSAPARSRLNATTIGSAIGQAVPKGAAGLTERQRANLADLIRSQITPCWNPPVVDEKSGVVTVTMRIGLDRAGMVIGTPSVVRMTGRTADNAAYANALSGSVRRAILRCAPLRLPADLYDAWSSVELTFDPKDVT